MIVIPTNPNLVKIPMVQTGCMKGFDPTYPVHLNGIIRPDEFEQSIININHTVVSTRIPYIIFGFIIVLCLLGGFVLCIFGGTRVNNGLLPLLGLGFGLLGLTLLCLLVGCPVIRSHRTRRITQAVAKESQKYSTRSPTPCSWRLSVTRWWSRSGRGGASEHISYRIAQNAAGHSNMIHPQSTPYFPQRNNILPPPYPGSRAGFCTQCGMPRQTLTASFCSSCGQPFNKY